MFIYNDININCDELWLKTKIIGLRTIRSFTFCILAGICTTDINVELVIAIAWEMMIG